MSTRAAAAPQDQADGLRRLFAGRRRQPLLALVANPGLAQEAAVLDRVATALATGGRRVLVADAAAGAPWPQGPAQGALAAAIEAVAPGVGYLPARGLLLQAASGGGDAAAGLVEALQSAAPSAVLLLHAEAADLARLLAQRAVRPLLLAGDDAASIRHAYAACKRLAQQGGLFSFDLLLATSLPPARAAELAARLGACADAFLGAGLNDWAAVDPDHDGADPALVRLLCAQLDGGATAARAWPALAARATGVASRPCARAPSRTAFR